MILFQLAVALVILMLLGWALLPIASVAILFILDSFSDE